MNRKNKNRVQRFFYLMPLFNKFVVHDSRATEFYYEDDLEGKSPQEIYEFVFNSPTWKAMSEIDSSKIPPGVYKREDYTRAKK